VAGLLILLRTIWLWRFVAQMLEDLPVRAREIFASRRAA
jgi:hypothetical protein